MPSWPDEASGRAASLAAAGHNVARLPSAAVTRELSTDAGRAHTGPLHTSDMGALVRSVFGADQVLVTSSGRDAEAVVASALIEPGQRVLANEAYVSSRWWIERFGGTVDDFGTEALGGPSSDIPDQRLDDLAYVLVTLPPAQLGPGAGLPVPLSQVQGIRNWIDRRCPQVPLVIDASRLWENASATETDPADFVALADITMLSAGKDIGAPLGGLVAGSDGRWWPRIVEAADVWRGLNAALDDHGLSRITDGLMAVQAGAAHDRYVEMMTLAGDLAKMGLPHTWAGCGSIYLDASAWLPHVSGRESPAQTLLNVIYLLTGWRGLGTASDDVERPNSAGQSPTVRLAVRDSAAELRAGLPIVAEVAADVRSGLRSLPPDRAAPYLRPALPVDPSAWPTASRQSSFARPAASSGWLVARPAAGCGPQRALAEALTRVVPGSTLQTADRVLRELHQRFTRVAPTPSLPEKVIVDAVGLPGLVAHEVAATDAMVLINIESPDGWPAVAALQDFVGVTVFWATAEGDAIDQRGLVAVRIGSPLAAALDAGSLFTVSSWLTPTDG